MDEGTIKSSLIYLHRSKTFFECTLYVSYVYYIIMYIMCEKILFMT